MAKKVDKKTKEFGSAKAKRYFVTDPERADRVLDLEGIDFALHADVQRKEVTAVQAKILKKNYPYLVIETE